MLLNVRCFASALLTGHEAEVRVVAGKQSRAPRMMCRGPINLTYPHFIYSTLCDVDPEVRQSVARGDVLILEGSGNSLGIFYRQMSLPE